VRLIGAIFLLVASLIAIAQQSLLVPLYLSLLAWLKSSLVSVITGTFKWMAGWFTPKFTLAFFKNSLFLQIRQALIKVSTHLFVMSHTPWRRRLANLRVAVFEFAKQIFNRYTQSPLWLRSAIALLLLVATASSSYLFIAILVIPQAVINWLRRLIANSLNKLGITRVALLLWNWLVPQQLRHRLYMYNKWTLGRRQIRASRRVTQSAAQLPKSLLITARRGTAKRAGSTGSTRRLRNDYPADHSAPRSNDSEP